MQVLTKKMKRRYARLGRKLLTRALDGFYYFNDDEIEDKIDQADLKYRRQGRIAVRSYIWSHTAIKNKICKVAADIFGTND